MSDILSKVEDIANTTGVAPSTIRKYSALIEKRGYKFSRNMQNALLYDETEIDFFKKLITLKKTKNTSLDDAIDELLPTIADMSEISKENIAATSTDIANTPNMSPILATMSDMAVAMADMQKKMDLILGQNKSLSEKVDSIKDDERKQIGERDKILVQSLRESQETKKLMLELKEQMIATITEKKSPWKFWK